jgi:hypothetical protein
VEPGDGAVRGEGARYPNGDVLLGEPLAFVLWEVEAK